MDWLPRWNEGYYNTRSPMRHVLWDGLRYHLNQGSRTAERDFHPGFWGQEGQARSAWIAVYEPAKDYVPAVSINNGQSAYDVRQVSHLSGLLYEFQDPTWCYMPDGTLWMRNLEMVSFSVASASGRVDMTSAYAAHPRMEDSPVLLVDDWLDETLLDPTSPRVLEQHVLVGKDSTYVVKYLSNTVHAWLAAGGSGLATLTIGTQTAKVTPVDVPNVWDESALWLGLERRPRESNAQLKRRIQLASMSVNEQEMLSAQLGTGKLLAWGGQNTLSFTSSGALSVRPVEDHQYQYRTESPAMESNTLRLASMPSSGCYVLYYRGEPVVNTQAFTLADNVLSLSERRLQQAERGDMLIKYKQTPWSLQTQDVSGRAYAVNLVAGQVQPHGTYVYITRKALVRNMRRRIRSWKWDVEQATPDGTAAFA